MECLKKRNKERCNCSYDPCPRKGMCCECLRHHWENGQLPACCFPKDVEKNYDRSIEKFIEVYQQRGKWW